MDKVKVASAFTCCFVCKKAAKDKCADCLVTRYCCREHQHQDWKQHKHICGRLQEEVNRRRARGIAAPTTTEGKVLEKMELAHWNFWPTDLVSINYPFDIHAGHFGVHF